MSGDPYLDPRTGALRNRLGIVDADELTQVESDLTVVQMVELERRHLPGRYDLPHLQDFHRFLFGDIYEWAGEPQEVFRALNRDDFLQGRERAEFLEGLAEHLANVNAIHPFREGNGRTQRAFLGQLARDAGYRIEWSTMEPEANLAIYRHRFEATTPHCVRCWTRSWIAPTGRCQPSFRRGIARRAV